MDRTTQPQTDSDTLAFVEAARLAVAEAMERDRALLRIRRKYAAKGASKAAVGRARVARKAGTTGRAGTGQKPVRKAARRSK